MSSSSPSSSDAPEGTLAAARREALARLRAAGVDAAEPEAAWLLEAVTGLSRAEQVLARTRPLTPAESRRLEALLRRRERREPLQLVLGETTFFGLRLQLDHGVLVPRPETERLVELALADAPRSGPWRVLDVGTGSGAVALAIAAAREGASVVASDVDPAAVRLARDNAERLGLRVAVFESDLLAHEAVRAAAAAADVVVANLPYLPDSDLGRVPPEVGWDPPTALYGGHDGLDVARRFMVEAAAVLRPEALVWLELDERNAGRLAADAAACGWIGARTECDLSCRARFVRLRPPAASRPCARP